MTDPRPTRLDTETDRLPLPIALDAERAVLAAMMLDASGETARKAAALVTARMFWQQSHSVLFDTILRLTQRGTPADLLTVCNELRGRDELEMIGGPQELSRVLDYATTTANTEHHARIVRDAHIRRELIHASDALAESARRGDVRPEEAWDVCRQRVEETAAPISGVDEMANLAMPGPVFMAAEFKQPRSLIGQSMLCEGGGGIIHAPAGEGKSFMGEQVAYAVASGTPWLGLFATPPGGLPVVLIQAELGDHHVQARRRAHPTYRECPPNLYTLTYERLGRYVDIIDPSDVDRIIRLIQRTGARLLVLDPLSQFHSEEENPAGFKRVRRAVQTISLKTGCADLLIHHEVKTGGDGKNQRDRGDRSRGAGILVKDWAEMACNIEKDAAGHHVMHFTKCRHCAKPRPVHMTQDEFGWWQTTEAPVPQATRTYTTVKAYLEHAAENGATYADLERATGVGRNPVRAALDKLAVERGLTGWADLNQGSRQTPRFVLPAMSYESAMSAGDSQTGIEW